jgi:hypothetical protein
VWGGDVFARKAWGLTDSRGHVGLGVRGGMIKGSWWCVGCKQDMVSAACCHDHCCTLTSITSPAVSLASTMSCLQDALLIVYCLIDASIWLLDCIVLHQCMLTFVIHRPPFSAVCTLLATHHPSCWPHITRLDCVVLHDMLAQLHHPKLTLPCCLYPAVHTPGDAWHACSHLMQNSPCPALCMLSSGA